MPSSITTTTTTKSSRDDVVPRPPKKNVLVCFSFAAYAKSVIDHLHSLDIPVLPGLSDLEFHLLESSYNLCFPPDLRSVLREGLPVGPQFPNWRSSSEQQLRLLIDLPRLNLLKNISSNTFWVDLWGDRPESVEQAVKQAGSLIDQAPVLIPIYRNCYIPSTNVAGNPVFYVDDREVRVISYDATRFFQEIGFLKIGVFRSVKLAERLKADAPAWAANTATRVGFWSEVAERGRRVAERGASRGWWGVGSSGLGACLEEAFWKLRDGGWGEEEVREMMDGVEKEKRGVEEVKNVGWQLAVVLLRGGWRMEDVADSLDMGGGSGCSLEDGILNSVNHSARFHSLEV